MDTLERLKILKAKPKRFTAEEATQFAIHELSMAGDECSILALDTSSDVLSFFGLSAVLKNTPVHIERNKKDDFTEVVYPALYGGLYLVIGLSRFVPPEENLNGLIHTQWSSAPAERMLQQPYLLQMKPDLENNFLKLLIESHN